jgi:tetratricopeptide (TPR) repeat protein
VQRWNIKEKALAVKTKGQSVPKQQQRQPKPAAGPSAPAAAKPVAAAPAPAAPAGAQGPVAGKQMITIKEALERAQRMLSNGRVKQAHALLSNIVRMRPRHADARNLLSVVLHRMGQRDEALKSVREAIRLNPNNANYYCNLGEMERQARNLAAATEALNKAIAMAPDNVQAHNNMGIVHYDRRQFAKAVECYRKVVSLRPNHAEAYNNLGNALRAMGKANEAIVEYENAIERRENYAEAYNNMGVMLREMQKFDEAEMAFRRAVGCRPNYIEATNNLASLLLFHKRYDDALRLLGDLLKAHPKEPQTLVNVARAQLLRGSNLQAERAVKALLAENPDNVQALNLYGQICHEMDRFDEALKSFEHALSIRPNDLEALNFYGIILKSVGRLDDARNAFIKALEIQPRALGAYSNIVDLEKFTPDNPLFVAMSQMVARAKNPEHERFMAMHFALGKAYDDMQEFDKALHHFGIGTRLKRAQLTYNEADVFSFFDEIRETFNEEYFKNRPFEGVQTTLPIFIIGMPRSGSTMTEQIIQSHPDVYGAGEIKTLSACIGAVRMKYPNLPKFPAMARIMRPTQFAAIGERYLKAVSSYSPDAKRVTDKLLTNYYFAGLLNTLFPQAKIIHTMRSPVDTCLSSYTKLFKDDMPHSYDFRDLGRYYGKYYELMAHWRKVLPPGAMLDVQYEDVVADTETKAKEIIAFLGLEWDERCLKFHESDRPVKTASVSQVRRPLYTSSVERWRRYGPGLDPLVDALEESGVKIRAS